MTRDIKSLLQYEAKRNSNIRQLLDDVDSLSEQDIDQLNVKPWIRKALKSKKNHNKAIALVAKAEARIIANSKFFYAPDKIGKVYKHVGHRRFVQLAKGEFELVEGALFWLPNDVGVWYETIFCNSIDYTIQAEFVKEVSKTNYIGMCRERVNTLS